jgi:small-conductance mechanosensitive channel
MHIRMALFLLIAWVSLASGQDATAPELRTTQTDETPAPTGTAELVQRLDTVSRRLLEINDYLRQPAPDLAGITVALPGKTREAESVLGGVATEFSGPDASADLMALAAVQQQLRNLDLIFDKWRTRLQEEITQLDPWREQLRSDAGFLREAANPPKPGPGALPVDQLPDALRSRLRDLAGEIETTREPLRKRLDVVVAADVRVGKLQTALSELQGQLDATRLGRQQQPLAVTAAPLWKLPASLRPPLALTRQNLVTLRVGIVDYLKARPAEVTTFVLILGVLLVSVARLRRSILAKGETGADALLTHYPFAVTLLVWTLVGPFLLLRDLPLGLSLLRGLIGIILLWRILPSLVTPLEIRPVKSLMLLGIAWLTKLIVLGDAWYGRLLAVVLGFLALLAFRELARRSTVEPGGRALFRRAIHGVAVVAPAIVAVGLIAEVVGARSLGQQAIGGIVFVLLALCALLAADAILRSIVDAWVGGPGARWSRGVRNWPEAVRTWGRRGTRLLLFIAFLNLLPGILPVLEPLWNAVGRLLTTAVTLGSLQLSLGDVLWFFIGISLALAVARLVRFVLDEDVLPRMPLSLGAASASSRLIYYALVVLGIVFALAASGVELSKLTLVISALGVGIGFGLQNIVNNFVSGLVLAFERPVREGDQVTLGQPGGQTSGRVDLIGLRATRIRTPDGAEVIVPNAMLISSEVTNWTLSDRARRIEIPVGVGADSDPGRIQALLLEAVAGQPGVAERPAPVAAFRGIGASSLDFSLYLWTDDIDDRLAVESEARGRVLAAIRTAGIEIPFPRVDLRVRDGVPPDATR